MKSRLCQTRRYTLLGHEPLESQGQEEHCRKQITVENRKAFYSPSALLKIFWSTLENLFSFFGPGVTPT